MESLIRKTYNDPQYGLISTEKLYQKLKSNGVSKKQIQDFLNKQESYQVYKKVTAPKHSFPIISKSPNELMQPDLMDFSDVYKTISNYKYLLIGIDVFTRKV